MPLALKNTAIGYEDAGIVVDIGPISDFAGITATGSGPLVENLWITDGPGAYVPGLHPPVPRTSRMGSTSTTARTGCLAPNTPT